MGRYACYRLFCLAVLVMLTRISAVDVNINATTDYDGVHVVLLHERLYSCYRHQPTQCSLVTRIVVEDIEGLTFTTSAPYLDVLIRGTSKYFKVAKSNWSSSTPFVGNKYNYYQVEDSEFAACEGLEYMKIYRESFGRHLTLSIWRNQRHVLRYTTIQGRLAIARSAIIINRVLVGLMIIWADEKNKGIIFVKALERRMHGRKVATLYFKDLNDNIIQLHYALLAYEVSYISPWKGYPKEYDVPDERLPSSFVSPRLEKIPLTVNVSRDSIDTVLLRVRNYEQGEAWVCVYIAHPNAHLKKFMSLHIKHNFQRDNIFIIAFTEGERYAQLQLLVYENDTTTLLVISSDKLRNGFTQVTDLSIIIYSFPLYTEAKVDERMYTRKNITIGGVESFVYTARPHLAFSQVYHDGVPVFVYGQANKPIKQFIIQDAVLYIVVREANQTDYLRFFITRDGSAWKRANDEHPDYIIV